MLRKEMILYKTNPEKSSVNKLPYLYFCFLKIEFLCLGISKNREEMFKAKSSWQ
jgi:hypothetical protein